MKINLRLSLFAIFIILAILFSLSAGTIYIPLPDILTFFSQLLHNNASTTNSNQDVLLYIRLPHIILSFIIGSALAVSGAVMQAILKNNLADPFLLGISSGGSLGAVIAILIGATNIFGFQCIGLFSFIGSLILTFVLLFLSEISRKKDPLSILLIGFALNALSMGLISLIISLVHNSHKTRSIQFWLMGQIRVLDWPTIFIFAILTIVIILFFMSQRRILDLMLVGDSLSLTMGRNLSYYRKLYILISAILVGSTVYIAGIIGFVGLIIPHIIRLLYGCGHKILIPLSALLGGCFLVLADVLSRNLISGTLIPIGISAAIFGSPIFIYLLLSSAYKKI